MSDTAAHLADRVLPRVPLRQWVLSVPRPMRYVFARDAKLISRALRIFWSEVLRHLKRKAGHRPYAEVFGGAVSGVQRFGGALNLNIHIHSLVLDGVYVWDDGLQALRFIPLPEPTAEELERVLSRVRDRLRRLLASKGFTGFEPLPDEETPVPDEALQEPSLFDSLQAGSIQEMLLLDGRPRRVPVVGRREGPYASAAEKPLCAAFDGFSLQAGVRIRKGDREGLERLCRYVLRPPFSQERLELLPDGRVRYGLRRERPDGTSHLILTPLEFLEKLAALIPPPRSHLVVYQGILAPNSGSRPFVVPAPRVSLEGGCGHPPKRGRRRRTVPDEEPATGDREPPNADVAPTGPGRTAWATLLRRTFGLDVLQCPRCPGRMELIAAITEPGPIRRILRHLDLPEDPLRAAPPRPPPDPGFEFDQT